MFQLDILGNTVKGLLKPVTLGMRELGDRGGGVLSFVSFINGTANLYYPLHCLVALGGHGGGRDRTVDSLTPIFVYRIFFYREKLVLR